MKVEELKKVLGELGWVDAEEDRGRLTAIVVAPSFEGMDEGQRQHVVWQHVLDRLDAADSAAIEFIFTYSPSEKERLDRGEALEELLD